MVNAFLILGGLNLWIGPVAAQDFRDCSWAPDQVTASNCAHEGWKDSDAELNRLWGIVKPRADARGAGQALLNEQRQWLRFRDGTCEGERDQFGGGSIAPQVYWSCMDRLTRARNAQLWQLQ
ncbi:MAG: lysozyme inhibitor LprI family protein [Pseudomonadota bacterium]